MALWEKFIDFQHSFFTLDTISPYFVKIYWEAESAENRKLFQIYWIWYRKAIEFLIKDYLINLKPELEEDIKKDTLWNCIKNYIDNKKIQEISKRAVWLWNDEIHYIRKWEDKDLSDLKKLIDITLYYIFMEIESDSIIEEMA